MKNLLFLDIETVAAKRTYSELSPRLQELWNKKARILDRNGEKEASELFEERAGIYAEFGKIIVIGLGFFTFNEHKVHGFRAKVLYGDDEKILLKEFVDLIHQRFSSPDTIMVAHNGKEFDFPYLSRRLLINGIELPPILDKAGKKPWEIPHIDTMELWKFGDWKNYTSLDLLAAIFDIPSSKSDIDGSMVNGIYYQENDLERIAEYCAQDVIVCAQVYLKLKGQDIIQAENIERVN